MKAKSTAGMPKRSTTSLSKFFPTNTSLNKLLEKCTIPVNAMATSTGKKIIIIGVKSVPNPNPEKNVRIATRKATTEISSISMFQK